MDIGFIALNIIKQIIFFVINVYVISYISHYISNDQENSILPATIDDILFALRRWTIGFVSDLVVFLVRFVSGAIIYESIAFTLEEYENLGDGSTKVLEINYDVPFKKRLRSYFPLTWIGGYLAEAAFLLFPLAVAITGFRFLAPDTFASVAEGLNAFTAFSSGTPNLELFSGMLRAFVDVVWNRFIVALATENLLLLIGIILLFFLCLGGTSIKLETKDGRGYALYTGIGASLLIIGANFAYASIDYSGYTALCPTINSAGMILLFVLIIGEIFEIAEYSGKKLINFIRKR